LTAHNNSYSRKDTRTAAEKGKQCKFVGGCLYIQKPEHCSHYLTRWPKDGMRGGQWNQMVPSPFVGRGLQIPPAVQYWVQPLWTSGGCLWCY